MDDLQRAVAWLEEMKALSEQTIEESKKLPYAVNNIRHYKRIENCRALLDALRQMRTPWIQVSERLPTCWESSPGNQIVAWAIHNDPYPRGKAYMTQYSGGWYYFGTNRKITGVTHWKIERGPESEG